MLAVTFSILGHKRLQNLRPLNEWSHDYNGAKKFTENWQRHDKHANLFPESYNHIRHHKQAKFSSPYALRKTTSLPHKITTALSVVQTIHPIHS